MNNAFIPHLNCIDLEQHTREHTSEGFNDRNEKENRQMGRGKL